MGMYEEQPGPNQRSGLSGRLIMGIIIALFGFFLYMTQEEKNPVTGKTQHVAISPNEEIRLGLESAPIMSSKMGGEIPSSDPRAQVVQNLGNYLVSHTIAKNSPWKFQFHLLADDKTVNAFALPGGQIFITLGLLNKLQNEAELAGVLGHEMGHVIERHTAEQMAKNQLGQTMAVAVGTAASDHSQNAYMLASFVNQMIQLRYGRQDESEADEWGIQLTTQAGFDPTAMIEVMKVLKAQSKGGEGLEIFQTHPNPDLRIKEIQEYLSRHPSAPNLKKGPTLKELYKNPELINQ